MRFVTIVPKLWDPNFNLTLKIKKRVMAGAKKSVGEYHYTCGPDNFFVVNYCASCLPFGLAISLLGGLSLEVVLYPT